MTKKCNMTYARLTPGLRPIYEIRYKIMRKGENKKYGERQG